MLIGTLPKPRLGGVTDRTPGVTPVPVRAADKLASAALDVTMMAPAAAPEVPGLKVTVKLAL